MSELESIRVLVVDDHPMVRRGLAAFLKAKPGLVLVGEAADGNEAMQICGQLQPDVVLMDLVMPEMDGIAATRAIRERWPRVQVIALTSFQEKDLVQGALQAGAVGYLLKNASADDLAEAIRGACAGRLALAPEAIEALLRPQSPAPAPGYDLSPREQEVLTLMVEGLNNPQIAARLVVSRATASFHVRSILAKLGVVNRAEAVVFALRHNLVK